MNAKPIEHHAYWMNFWQFILAFVVGAVSIFPLIYFPLKHSLMQSLKEQTEVFQHFSFGVLFSDDDSFEDAIHEFRQCSGDFTDPKSYIYSADRLSLFLSKYLYCISGTTTPSHYSADFFSCLDIINKNLISPTAEQKRYIAWCFLNLKEQEKADFYFWSAINDAKIDGSNSNMAWAYYGLAYSSLCAGNFKLAHNYSSMAGYLQKYEDKFIFDEQAPQNILLSKLYPEFSKSLFALQCMFGEDQERADKGVKSP